MSEEARKKLAERLREAREYLGLSQEDAAEHVGIPRPAISQLERGNRRVDAIELASFAKLYQRPVSYFTGEEGGTETAQIEVLNRLKEAAAELSETDREEVVRFAEFLRTRSTPGKDR
jgi:transcriptional regulator with XRE-family HTH domain